MCLDPASPRPNVRSFPWLVVMKRLSRQVEQLRGEEFGEFYSKLHAEERLREEVQDPHNSETRMNTQKAVTMT